MVWSDPAESNGVNQDCAVRFMFGKDQFQKFMSESNLD